MLQYINNKGHIFYAVWYPANQSTAKYCNVEIIYNHLCLVEYLGLVICNVLSIAMKDVWTSVVNWPNIRPHNEKGPKKSGPAGRIWGRIFPKFVQKGPKSRSNLWKFCFLTLALSNSTQVQDIILVCFSTGINKGRFFQKNKCLWKGKFTRGRIFSSAAEFFPRELTGKVCQELATLV
jgi:hypothetical protein